MILVGDNLEALGWRQGSIVKQEDIPFIFKDEKISDLRSCLLIVASQSCDVAYNEVSKDPFVEFSVARRIKFIDENCSFNKNPRTLHVTLQKIECPDEVEGFFYVELKAFEKISLKKEQLLPFSPAENIALSHNHMRAFVFWLAARYSRPALPTEFNARIAQADPRAKLKKKAKKMDSQLSGLYIQINPDAEISKDSHYEVNLLGLVSSDFSGDISLLKKIVEDYAVIISDAGINVVVNVLPENEVSVAVINRFKRFYYDDLSIRNNSPLPTEIKTNA